MDQPIPGCVSDSPRDQSFAKSVQCSSTNSQGAHTSSASSQHDTLFAQVSETLTSPWSFSANEITFQEFRRLLDEHMSAVKESLKEQLSEIKDFHTELLLKHEATSHDIRELYRNTTAPIAQSVSHSPQHSGHLSPSSPMANSPRAHIDPKLIKKQVFAVSAFADAKNHPRVAESVSGTHHSWQKTNLLRQVARKSAWREVPENPKPEACELPLHLDVCQDSTDAAQFDYDIPLPPIASKSTVGEVSENVGEGSEKPGRTMVSLPTATSLKKKRKVALRITKSWNYEFARMMLVFLDVGIVLGEVEYASSQVQERNITCINDQRVLMVIADLICLSFIADLLFRYYAKCGKFFKTGSHWKIFNMFATFAFSVECIVRHILVDQRGCSLFRSVVYQIALIRMFRLAQIVATLNLVKNNDFSRELWLMVSAVLHAVNIAIWSAVMIGSLCFGMGIFFTEGFLRYVVGFSDWDDEELFKSFGGAFKSALSCYKAMSSGQDWGELYDLLATLGWIYQIAFLFFILAALVVLLNVVTAVFVESAIERSKCDRKFRERTAVKTNKDFLITMSKIFQQIDKNRSGTITLADFEKRMHDEDLGAYFDSLGINTNQATDMFQLLDKDDSGGIDEEEFMFGLMQIRGEAKGLDIALMRKDMLERSREMSSQLTAMRGSIRMREQDLRERLDHLEQRTGVAGNGCSDDTTKIPLPKFQEDATNNPGSIELGAISEDEASP